MKKNRVWVVLVGLFCLVTSGATVYATSYHVENQVGVRFFESTGTTNSTTTTTSSTTDSSSFSSSSSSSTVPSSNSSSLPDTEQKGNSFMWLRNDDGGGTTGGTTRYYDDNKLLPSTGELIHLALPFAGVFLLMLVFFYLRKNKEEKA
ncbi:LPXTG cell wall anchor domain-containing protein [Enterococcus malodoratus]|uniref:LPXTG cell wall anchor domain-containing protein n=1 Tax=Enterococcus malodoratus TaxID=71451 RepID=UPI003FCFFAD2